MDRSWLGRIAGSDLWQACRDHLLRSRPGSRAVADRQSLAHFVRTRAAHVAQTSLYGYLRTRAGGRYPELFADETFVASLNIAKWHVWLACVSDLSVYAGALLAREAQVQPAQIHTLMGGMVDDILAETGIPPEAGPEFEAHAKRIRARLSDCDWGAFADDGAAFTESPAALVQWAPIVEELKRLDEDIVRNSVRFRWSEVRRDLRRDLDCKALLACAASSAPEDR